MLCKWEGDNIRKVMVCNGVEVVMVPIGGEYLEKSQLERMGASTLWPAHGARLGELLKCQVGKKQVHKHYQTNILEARLRAEPDHAVFSIL